MPTSGKKISEIVAEHGHDTVDGELRPQPQDAVHTVTRIPRTALLAAEYAETLRRPWRRNTKGEDYIPEQSKPPSLRGSMRPSAPPTPVAACAPPPAPPLTARVAAALAAALGVRCERGGSPSLRQQSPRISGDPVEWRTRCPADFCLGAPQSSIESITPPLRYI